MSSIVENIQEIEKNFKILRSNFFLNEVKKCIDMIYQALIKKNKVIFCGNGGSASDSEHISTELIGRYLKKRKAYAAISLTSNSAAITAIANDYGYENIFSRQLESIGKKNDILFALSTSGKSKNIIKALKFAKSKRLKSILLTSQNYKGSLKIANLVIKVPSKRVDRIQEMHIAIGHMICEQIEKKIK